MKLIANNNVGSNAVNSAAAGNATPQQVASQNATNAINTTKSTSGAEASKHKQTAPKKPPDVDSEHFWALPQNGSQEASR